MLRVEDDAPSRAPDGVIRRARADFQAPPVCPACSSEVTAILYELPRLAHDESDPVQHQVRRCGRCGLGLLHPQPSDAELGRFYAGDYYTHRIGTGPEDARATFPERVLSHLAWRLDGGRQVVDDLPALADGRKLDVVELGCGGGGVLARLAALGHRVVGVDPDPEALAAARARGVRVLQGTAEEPPGELAPASADLVLILHALEHCRDPMSALASARQLARAGGRLVVEVPNAASLAASRGPAWWHFDGGRHLWWWTPTALRRAIERAGFAFERWTWNDFCVHYRPERLADEQRYWHTLCRWKCPVRRPTRLGRWLDFARTAFAPPAWKYEVMVAWAHLAAVGG